MRISQINHESDDIDENQPETPGNEAIFGQNGQKPVVSEQNPSNSAQNEPDLTFFPPFSRENYSSLDIIQRQFAKNPHYFELPQCKYPPEIRLFLKKILGASPMGNDQIDQKIDEFFGDELMYDRIIRDSKRAYMNLASQMTLMEAQKDIDSAVAFTKALSNLQQRLLEIQERAEGLKMIHEFKRAVLSVIDSELTPDQRTGIMNKITGLIQS